MASRIPYKAIYNLHEYPFALVQILKDECRNRIIPITLSHIFQELKCSTWILSLIKAGISWFLEDN
jgi:hypothetical protein